MNNLKKIGLSALAGSLVAMSAHAADVSISGGASVAITSGDQTGKSTYYQNDSISFTVSGETDGGLSITTSLELDGDASGGQGGDFDSQSLTIGHDTFGTVIFSGHGGSTVMGGWDDMVPNAYEESWAVTTGNLLINGAGTGNKLWRYNSPELLDGLTAHFAYSSQNTTANANSYTDMGVMYKPSMLEGLTLGYGVGEVDEVPAANGDQVTGIDESTMFVTYATGPVTIGYQTSEADGSTSTQDDDSTSVGISYAVTDDLSVSYGEHSLDLGSSTSDQESEGMSVSYTMGGTSIKATMNETTSVAGVSGTDRESYEIALVFAF